MTTQPRARATTNGTPYQAQQPTGTYRRSTPRQRQQARRQRTSKTRTTNRTKNGGFHVHIHGKNSGNGGGGGAQGEWSRKSPIGDAEFLSAGHVREFAEKGRRAMREAAIDLAYAAEALKLVLREVPPPDGQGRAAAYIRARRVARSLKRAATAAQAASAHCARTWPAFMREYAPELNTYRGPRPNPRARRMNFGA